MVLPQSGPKMKLAFKNRATQPVRFYDILLSTVVWLLWIDFEGYESSFIRMTIVPRMFT